MNDGQESRWLVACLCAQWCGTCRDYRATFERQAAAHAGRVRFAWVDVENEADIVGDLEVENFPTLLIAHGERAVFFGTVMPHEATLARLVENALAGAASRIDDPEVAALAGRIERSSARS